MWRPVFPVDLAFGHYWSNKDPLDMVAPEQGEGGCIGVHSVSYCRVSVEWYKMLPFLYILYPVCTHMAHI